MTSRLRLCFGRVLDESHRIRPIVLSETQPWLVSVVFSVSLLFFALILFFTTGAEYNKAPPEPSYRLFYPAPCESMFEHKYHLIFYLLHAEIQDVLIWRFSFWDFL
ncbi:hypothetical protein NQD34_009282 [Periophthalmus magnuspinnatus]|nr:hypothetical protein NQD34_009282 [Periophthalmus magnuspinnatus]